MTAIKSRMLKFCIDGGCSNREPRYVIDDNENVKYRLLNSLCK